MQLLLVEVHPLLAHVRRVGAYMRPERLSGRVQEGITRNLFCITVLALALLRRGVPFVALRAGEQPLLEMELQRLGPRRPRLSLVLRAIVRRRQVDGSRQA